MNLVFVPIFGIFLVGCNGESDEDHEELSIESSSIGKGNREGDNHGDVNSDSEAQFIGGFNGGFTMKNLEFAVQASRGSDDEGSVTTLQDDLDKIVSTAWGQFEDCAYFNAKSESYFLKSSQEIGSTGEFIDWFHEVKTPRIAVYFRELSEPDMLNGIRLRADLILSFAGWRYYYKDENHFNLVNRAKGKSSTLAPFPGVGWTQWEDARTYNWKFEVVNGEIITLKCYTQWFINERLGKSPFSNFVDFQPSEIPR